MKDNSILCLNFSGSEKEETFHLDLLGTRFNIHELPARRNLRHLKRILENIGDDFSAVAVNDFPLSIRVNGQSFPYIHNLQVLRDLPVELVCDGTGTAEILEKYFINLLLDRNELADLDKKNLMILSGTDFPGLSSILPNKSEKVIFGDLLYNIRLGIPILSYQQYVKVTTSMIPVLANSRPEWSHPRGRRGETIFPKFNFYFRWADVVLGTYHHFERYLSIPLPGRFLLTYLQTERQKRYYEGLGITKLISFTPRIGGRLVHPSLLEVMLELLPIQETERANQDYRLDVLRTLRLQPEVDLFADASRSISTVDRAFHDGVALTPAFVKRITKPAGEDLGKFIFAIHPLEIRQLLRHPLLRNAPLLPPNILASLASQLPPVFASHITDIRSHTGARAEGWLFAIPMTPREMLRRDPEFTYSKILEIAMKGKELGAGIIGLGAFTSVVGDAGVTIAERAPIAVTSGNSLTISAAVQTLKKATRQLGLSLPELRTMVIGATGSIGSALSEILARSCAEVILIAPRPEKLLLLADRLEKKGIASIKIGTKADQHLEDADIIITATSALTSTFDVMSLRPGSLVCDVAQPPNISPKEALKREDVLFIEAGEFQVPEGTIINYDLGLPEGVVYACLAETMVLALEKRYEDYTIGRRIVTKKVYEIEEMAERHGFRLAPLRSFGRELEEEDFQRMRRNLRSEIKSPRIST